MKVLLYQGISVVSKIIKWQTRSQYSHAAVELDDSSVIESWHKGVEHVKDYRTNHTSGTVVDVFGIKAPSENIDLAESIFLKQVGRKYDFQGVFNFVTREDINVDERLFCSESVMTGFNEAGIYLLERIKPNLVSPRDIHISPLLYFIEKRIV